MYVWAHLTLTRVYTPHHIDTHRASTCLYLTQVCAHVFVSESEHLLIHMQTPCPSTDLLRGETSREWGKEQGWVTIRNSTIHSTCTHYMPHAITSNQTQLDTHTRTQKNKGVQKSAIRTSRHTAKKKKSLQHTHLKRIQSGYWNTHAHAARTPSLANTITHVHRCGRSILFSLTPIPFAQSPANRTDVTGQI